MKQICKTLKKKHVIEHKKQKRMGKGTQRTHYTYTGARKTGKHHKKDLPGNGEKYPQLFFLHS